MPREIEEPTLNEHGGEVHPAFGLIGASRGQSSPPGTILFDSDIPHQNTVTVTVYEAARERSLSHDRISPVNRKGVLAEVQMSEAQWASFVSSMNVGSGVPCTIRRRDGDWNIPGLAYAPRLQESMDEVRTAGDRAMVEIREAFAVVEEKPTKANLRILRARIENATPNMEFAAQSLNEHAENVVQRARAEIEAMVFARAQQLGIDPGALSTPQLAAGDDGPHSVQLGHRRREWEEEGYPAEEIEAMVAEERRELEARDGD